MQTRAARHRGGPGEAGPLVRRNGQRLPRRSGPRGKSSMRLVMSKRSRRVHRTRRHVWMLWLCEVTAWTSGMTPPQPVHRRKRLRSMPWMPLPVPPALPPGPSMSPRGPRTVLGRRPQQTAPVAWRRRRGTLRLRLVHMTAMGKLQQMGWPLGVEEGSRRAQVWRWRRSPRASRACCRRSGRNAPRRRCASRLDWVRVRGCVMHGGHARQPSVEPNTLELRRCMWLQGSGCNLVACACVCVLLRHAAVRRCTSASAAWSRCAHPDG